MSMTESYLRHTISLHSFFVECFVFFHTVLFKWLCSSLGGLSGNCSVSRVEHISYNSEGIDKGEKV